MTRAAQADFWQRRTARRAPPPSSGARSPRGDPPREPCESTRCEGLDGDARLPTEHSVRLRLGTPQGLPVGRLGAARPVPSRAQPSPPKHWEETDDEELQEPQTVQEIPAPPCKTEGGIGAHSRWQDRCRVTVETHRPADGQRHGRVVVHMGEVWRPSDVEQRRAG
jgi:hypothetical protein